VTRYLPLPLEAPRIDRQSIPSGLAGTKLTAAHVGRLIREGSADFYVRQKAIDILLARGVAPKDYIGEIDALFRWVQRHVRYTKDPFQVEVLHAPRRMLELRAGDCDDMTILLGSLVKSVGHPVRLVLTGPNPRRPDLFSHIYLEAQCQGDWIPLDATMPFAMGWSPRAPVRLVLSIDEDSTHGQRPARTDNTPAGTSTTARPTASAGRGPGPVIGSRAGIAGSGTSRTSPGPGAGARVAPRLAARDTQHRSAAARPAREGVVGRVATPTTARAERVDQVDLATHLAAGTRAAAPPAHDGPDGGAASRVGIAPGAADAKLRKRRLHEARDNPAAPTAASRHAASRRDRATAAGAATAPGAQTVPAPATAPGQATVPGDATGPGHAPAAGDATGAGDATRSTDAAGKTRALSSAVQDASTLYRRFSRLPPRSVQRVSHQRVVPPVVVELGQLVAVMYRSDKWVGHPRTYIHYMEDPPRLVCDVAGRQLFVVGGNYRITARGIEG
jgi:hypothetical protein